MKKLLIASLIIFTMCGQASQSAELFSSPEDLQNFDAKFYEGPTGQLAMPEVQYVNGENSDGAGDYHKFSPNATSPLFKKIRIKLTNMYRIRNHKQELKEIERQKELMRREAEESGADVNEEGFEVNEDGLANIKIEPEKDMHSESAIKDAVNAEMPGGSNPIALTGDVKKLVAPKDLQMDCDKMEYFEDRNEIEATGHAFLLLPAQKITLKADKFIYNMESNILKAYDNVQLTKDGKVIKGDFIVINLNEESATIDNMTSAMSFLKVEAENATTETDKLILKNGRIFSDVSHRLFFRSSMIGPRIETMLIGEEDWSYIPPVNNAEGAFNIDAEEVYIKATKNHNIVTVKNADIYYRGHEVIRWPSFTAYVNKNNDYFEANYPEIGSIPRLGMFVGPGFVFPTPFDSTIKIAPVLNYKDDLGVGGIVRYKSATNMTDAAYASAPDIWYVKGRQRLDDNLYLQYGMNSYLDDWFMGRHMGKYVAEFIYDDQKSYKDFLGDGRRMRFRHRVGAGYMHDCDINRHGEKINSPMIGTTRLKYMAEIDQSLWSWQNEEERELLDFGIALQGSAAVYGTGDTQVVGRIGPRLHSQYKNWMQDVGYFISAYDDNSPLPRYDTYRYGRSNVYLREAIRLHKYLTVAWSGSMNLSGDAPNDQIFQENAFIVSLGPDECKLSLGYDFIRNRTYVGIIVDLDTKGSSLEFDKMEIKNPDRLSKSKDEEKLITFEQTTPTAASKPKQLQYATVIELEDPNKEQL